LDNWYYRVAQFGEEFGVKKELMDILACPVCKGPLRLTIDEENEEEIVAGSLRCEKCNRLYPIVDAIPNLLPPDTQESRSGA